MLFVLMPGSEAVFCGSSIAHYMQAVWQCAAGVVLPTAPWQCGGGRHEFHRPRRPLGVAVCNTSSTGQCPKALPQCVARVLLPTDSGR